MFNGFLAYASLIHLSSMAALTLGLLAGSGSRRDSTNDTAPAARAQTKASHLLQSKITVIDIQNHCFPLERTAC